MHNLDLSLSDISKIEGRASCDIKIRNGKVEHVDFSIAEYKRFYTQAIRGKDIVALPSLTSRICGTCSNAHLLCALKAVENAVGLVPSKQTLALRKLLNYGLIIRDHALHLYVFVLPDLFSKDSILDFNENDPREHKFLDDAFSVKAAGNWLGKRVGGRSVHAPNLTMGGFIKLPQVQELKKSISELAEIRPKVLDLIEFFSKRDTSLIHRNIDFAAVCDDEYCFLYGDTVKTKEKTIPADEYGNYLKHITTSYSHASRYMFGEKVYMTGALARLNLAKNNLHPQTKKDLKDILDVFPSQNIFHNNLAQAIEILHAIDSSLTILQNIEIKGEKPVRWQRKKGTGVGVIEAPRGALYYKMIVDENGKIIDGQIVVPTGQNQICIEESIKYFLEENIKNLEDKKLIEEEIEKIVRAFDPCMSCASHFLKVKWL